MAKFNLKEQLKIESNKSFNKDKEIPYSCGHKEPFYCGICGGLLKKYYYKDELNRFEWVCVACYDKYEGENH